MTLAEVLSMIAETEKYLQKADNILEQLVQLPNPPHSGLIDPTVKLRGRLEKDIEELLELKATLEV